MTTYNSSPVIDENGRDVYFDEAVRLVIETGKASASLIQRKLNLGYARSARLIDELEEAGIIGPSNGANPREIFISHGDADGSTFVAKNVPEPKILEIPTLKWKKTNGKETSGFTLEVGVGDQGEAVTYDLQKYGNLLMIGSQYTALSQLVNQLIATKIKEHSPDELKLVVVDGLMVQIDLPQGTPHLLTPLLRNEDRVSSALKWVMGEINHRSKLTGKEKKVPKILVVVHGFNELYVYPDNLGEMLARIMSTGREVGVYLVVTLDYIDNRLYKGIVTNSPARLVFKPTTKLTARSSGIPESIKLEKPNEAILETMFEGKQKVTVTEINTKKIYEEALE